MKKTLALICLSFMLTSAAFAASSRENLQSRMDAAKAVLDEIMKAQDRSIPLNILHHATCVAVVPGMVKGALIFGGQYGARRYLFAWRAARGDCRSAANPRTWFWWR